MLRDTITTPTLVRSVRRALREAFKEATQRFEPQRGALLYRPEGDSLIEVTSCGGFASQPSVDGPELRWEVVHECFSKGETVQQRDSDASFLGLPMKRPPEGWVIGVLYFETKADKRVYREDEVFSMEALAARTGAEMAVLRKRLLSDVQRVLPTSDLVENWTGIRRAGLEAYEAGVHDMALSFLERAKDQAEEWGPCQELAQSLNDYGQVLRANERLEDAKQQFERGMSILEQAGLERDLKAIPILNNLGGVHHAQGNLKEAEGLYQLGLEIMSDQKKENRATPALMSNLGVISVALGDPASARVWFQQAVASATRLFGADHPATEKCRQKLEEL
jgi:tetratricopeptide (TPR) repeat protein